MNFKITSSGEGTSLINNGTENFLAIDTGLKNRSFIGVDTSRLQSLPGIIIDNGEIHNWKLKGITEIDGRTFFYGPSLTGKSFADLELTSGTLLELTSALLLIKDRNFPVRNFSLSSVFRTDDGKILFFPPYLMDFLNTHRLSKNSLKMIDPWNNRKLGGNSGRSFTIATLVYKTITGEIPFSGENEEEIEKNIIQINYKSPRLRIPAINENILQLIEDSFSGNGDLGKWPAVLNSWQSDGLIDTSISSEEKTRITEAEKKQEKKRIQKKNRMIFFNKNRTKLTIGSILVIILALILQAPISKAMKPPSTIGMTQQEVIELFYSCYKSLNTEILEDTITKKAGKSDINEISTIYVTTKVRTSYEGSTGMVDPAQWKLDGMKPVEPGIQVWGISDLLVKQISTDTYEAIYEKWSPAIVDDIEDKTPQLPIGYKIKDIIHLSLIDDAWKIDELERIINNL